MGTCSVTPNFQDKVQDSSWYKKDIKFIVLGNLHPFQNTPDIVDVWALLNIVGAVVWVFLNIKGAVVWAPLKCSGRSCMDIMNVMGAVLWILKTSIEAEVLIYRNVVGSEVWIFRYSVGAVV